LSLATDGATGGASDGATDGATDGACGEIEDAQRILDQVSRLNAPYVIIARIA